jgi:chemotaxis protein methyltransferase CheR
MAGIAIRPRDYKRFLQLIRDRSGLEFEGSRRAELERAIVRATEVAALSDAGSLYRRLTEGDQSAEALEHFISSLTIGETYFFRSQAQFDALEQHILPDLIAKRSVTRRLRLWSAGCASGEEAYSLAIMLERLIPDLDRWKIFILGTDLNRDALEKARAGHYGEWSFRGVAPRIRRSHFVRNEKRFEIAPTLRNRVTFAHLNLVEDAYPSPATDTMDMDLILCRNVAIYFGEDTIRAVFERLHRAMADDGWLLLGPVDPSLAKLGLFRSHILPGAVAYTKSHQSPAQNIDQAILGDASDATGSSNAIAGSSPLPIVPGNLAPASPDEAMNLEDLIARARRDESNPRAAYLAATILAGQGQLEEAERWLDLALHRDPLHAPAHHLRGTILHEGGRPDEALVALRRAVYADPRFAAGHVTLAAILLKQGQIGRAHKALESADLILAGRDPAEPAHEDSDVTVGSLMNAIDQYRVFRPGDVPKELSDG